ncbi:MAG: hypothetical protein IJD91_09505 [Clostridia bacterium]|nr:hypothetical protein [Clostridia bacterium]
MKKFLKSAIFIAIVLVGIFMLSVVSYAAEITLPDIISDHMLIQQGEAGTLWGTAGAGETVTVKLTASGKTLLTAKGTAGNDGKFKITFGAIPPGGPYNLEFSTESASKTVTDVMVGEVWLQGGQSNMALRMRKASLSTQEMLPESKINDIRLFINTKDEPMTERAENVEGKWVVADKETVLEYSAIGYLALKVVYDELDVPVGGICFAVDGKGMSYFSGPTSKGGVGKKGYNAKYAAIVDYNVRGVMWNQFSADRENENFASDFNQLIKSWRLDRGDDDLPFVFITGYPSPMKYFASWTNSYIMEDWSIARLGQIETYYNTPNTAFIVTMDLPPQATDSDPLHPKDKRQTGIRLGKAVLGSVYGKVQNWQSPHYKISRKDGEAVEIEFSYAYGGLKTTDGQAPRCFFVGKTENNLREAKAEIINENTIRLTAEGLKDINFVSYATEAHMYPYTSVEDAVTNTYPDVNLVNSEGLPAAPFAITAGEERREKTFSNFAAIGKRLDTVKRDPKPAKTEMPVEVETPVEPETPVQPETPATDEITILIDGEKLVCDQPPVIIEGRTLVPMRAIFEKLGAEVGWDGATSTASGVKDGKTVSFVIGEKFIGINAEKKALDVPAQIINSRTMIPARAVAEAFGCTVDWDGETQTVIIKTK